MSPAMDSGLDVGANRFDTLPSLSSRNLDGERGAGAVDVEWP